MNPTTAWQGPQKVMDTTFHMGFRGDLGWEKFSPWPRPHLPPLRSGARWLEGPSSSESRSLIFCFCFHFW